MLNLIHFVPARYVFASLTFFGLTCLVAMRVNLSTVIVVMVNNTLEPSANETRSGSECGSFTLKHRNISQENETKTLDGEERFDWDIETQSMILGCFYYGYTIAMIPGGVLVQRFGGKWLFGGSILVTSVMTLLTPLAAEWSMAALIGIRVIQGIAQGPTFSAVCLLVAQWIPVKERSFIFTTIYSGVLLGNTIGISASGVLAGSSSLGGWPTVFYIFGTFGCVVSVLWIVLVFETPSCHPGISDTERRFIQEDLSEPQNKPVPWIAMLTSVPAWALNIANFGFTWVLFYLMTEMPTYLANVLHFDIETNGIICAVPYILQALSGLGASHIADRLHRNDTFKITTIRKIMNSIGGWTTEVFYIKTDL